ncbi:hypothetical protein CHU92_06590 [Flavobacterium cyanobacteriorum]|uniref:Uncharacterized protein n=2 Tax=Flavobacterium cyanobacteriorum TaxID=2022802 RepID=A0A255Z9J8_9FLAO|nr:hypothetical protein CHU92_06590 [Flavobacterium cyanobacteriorum]
MLSLTIGYAQERSNDKPEAISFRQISPEKKFDNDSKKNVVTIYTLGGLKPSNHDVDQTFQKKFNVNYYDFGCLAPGNLDYYEKYNVLVFNYLKEKWNNEWEKDIKDNAIGFYNWKKTH